MKKLLFSSIAMLLLAISITLIQISCTKEAHAQTNANNYVLPSATTSTLGGVIIGNGLTVSNNGTLSVTPSSSGGLTQLGKVIFKKVVNAGTGITAEIWTIKYDGSDAAKVNIVLPSGISFSDDMNPIMSPNGQKIFFTAGATGTSNGDLYSCNADGSAVTKLVDKGGTNNNIILGEAY